MAFFALIILDNQANTVAIKPTGAEFQQPFLDKVAQEETQHDGPHPNVYDMGGYYLHSLWSGKKPFIIEPEYIVGVVSDASEDEAQIKRALRKITNNALLSLK